MEDNQNYEAVLIQLELQSGELISFMIAANRENCSVIRLLREEIGWRWHCWQVSSEDASRILSGKFTEDLSLAERVNKAVKNPNYAHSLESDIRPSPVSISISKDYLLTADRVAICHMHIA